MMQPTPFPQQATGTATGDQHLQMPEQKATLQDHLDRLRQFGGMRLIKTLIREAEKLDTRNQAEHDIFLNDAVYESERRQLAVTLDLWIDFLSSSNETEDWEREATVCEERMGENMSSIRESIQELETSYRTLGLFFANVNREKVDFLSLINADKGNLEDLTSPDAVAVVSELNDKYDTLDLRKSYSLLVIPGYLNDSSKKNIDAWAKVAYDNKVLLITDFQDCPQYDDLLFLAKKASLQGSSPVYSSTIVTCNYILSRRKSELSGEYDDLYVPASGALAGRMTDVEHIPIAQGVAGKNYGCLEKALSVRFDMTKANLGTLIDLGMVPVVEVSGMVYAFSNSTLYNGSVKELQEYSIVRVFDWVSKVLLQYCNDQAFTNWSNTVEENMKEEIRMFLHSQKGEGRLIDDFAVCDIHRNPQTGDILVQVELKPFFAARNFLIELKGKSELGKLTFHLEDKLS